MKLSVATTALILLASQVHASEKDRILPTSAAAKIEVTYNMDGQAMYVTIKNGSHLTVTSGTLDCDKYDTKLPKPSIASTGFPWCPYGKLTNVISGSQKNCEHDSGYASSFEKTIKPGKVTKLYFEPKDYQVPLIRCDIYELRGREAKLWDF